MNLFKLLSDILKASQTHLQSTSKAEKNNVLLSRPCGGAAFPTNLAGKWAPTPDNQIENLDCEATPPAFEGKQQSPSLSPFRVSLANARASDHHWAPIL